MSAASGQAGTGRLLWSPDPTTRPRMRELADFLEARLDVSLPDYDALWRLSVDRLEDFWAALWEWFDIEAGRRFDTVLDGRQMPEVRWFTGAELSYARHALRRARDDPDGDAVVEESESRPHQRRSWAELENDVARAATGLRRLGVGSGDRVAGYLPNSVEAVVAFLASASIGAIWSSCPPEFGADAALSRFAQIQPSVLLACDGYVHGGRRHDRTVEVEALVAGLPTLRAVVAVPFVPASSAGQPARDGPTRLSWSQLTQHADQIDHVDVPFDHPLYILYSSGTTGIPKAIVHSHGAMVLEHLKMLVLHLDMRPGDRFLWFTTTGWMMWNYNVSALLVGATVVLYDGNPSAPDPYRLFDLAARNGLTHLGVSATYIMNARKQGLVPREHHDLRRLRHLGSTGSPLAAEGAEWVYECVSDSVVLGSASGGSDVCSAFVGASPLVPVWAGEISCRCLAVDVHAYDSEGAAIVGELGELVVVQPMPSMPVSLWGDEDGSRLRDAYYSVFPGVWRHGDWVEFAERGSSVITGRSDATLNRGGVRLGTAELYTVVEDDPAIVDSLVVHLDGDVTRPAGSLVLLVQLVPGTELDGGLTDRLRGAIRRRLSPRHVPDTVAAVPVVPRTVTGKKLEVPVKRYLQGAPLADVADPGALLDPEALASMAAALEPLRSIRTGRGR